jgi:hypothetical protein
MTDLQPDTGSGAAASGSATRETGPTERLIEGIASGLGNAIGWLAEHGILFVFFLVLWAAFGAALLWSQGSLHDAWEWVGGLPLLAQLLVWLLFLPVMAGLWAWETDWPLMVRLVVILGLAGWTLLAFLPRGRTSTGT